MNNQIFTFNDPGRSAGSASELHKMAAELLSSVRARILAGETIEQIYASMGLEYEAVA